MKEYIGYPEGEDFKGSLLYSDLIHLQDVVKASMLGDAEMLGVFCGMQCKRTDTGWVVAQGLFNWSDKTLPATFEETEVADIRVIKYLLIYEEATDERQIPVSIGTTKYDAYKKYTCYLSDNLTSSEPHHGELVKVMPFVFRKDYYPVSMFEADHEQYKDNKDGDYVPYLGSLALLRTVGDNVYLVVSGCFLGSASDAAAIGGAFVDNEVVIFGNASNVAGSTVNFNIENNVDITKYELSKSGPLGVILGQFATYMTNLARVAYTGNYYDLKEKLKEIDGLALNYKEELDSLTEYSIPAPSGSIDMIIAKIVKCLDFILGQGVVLSNSYKDLDDKPTAEELRQEVEYPGEIKAFKDVASIPEGWHVCDGLQGTTRLTGGVIIATGGISPITGDETNDTSGMMTAEGQLGGQGQLYPISYLVFGEKLTKGFRTVSLSSTNSVYGSVGFNLQFTSPLASKSFKYDTEVSIYAIPASYSRFVKWEYRKTPGSIPVEDEELATQALIENLNPPDDWETLSTVQNVKFIMPKVDIEVRAVFKRYVEVRYSTSNEGIGKVYDEDNNLVANAVVRVDVGNNIILKAQALDDKSINYLDSVLLGSEKKQFTVVENGDERYVEVNLGVATVEQTTLDVTFVYGKRVNTVISSYGSLEIDVRVESPTTVLYGDENNLEEVTLVNGVYSTKLKNQTFQEARDSSYSGNSSSTSARISLWLPYEAKVSVSAEDDLVLFNKAYIDNVPQGGNSVELTVDSSMVNSPKRIDFDGYLAGYMTLDATIPDSVNFAVTIGGAEKTYGSGSRILIPIGKYNEAKIVANLTSTVYYQIEKWDGAVFSNNTATVTFSRTNENEVYPVLLTVTKKSLPITVVNPGNTAIVKISPTSQVYGGFVGIEVKQAEGYQPSAGKHFTESDLTYDSNSGTYKVTGPNPTVTVTPYELIQNTLTVVKPQVGTLTVTVILGDQTKTYTQFNNPISVGYGSLVKVKYDMSGVTGFEYKGIIITGNVTVSDGDNKYEKKINSFTADARVEVSLTELFTTLTVNATAGESAICNKYTSSPIKVTAITNTDPSISSEKNIDVNTNKAEFSFRRGTTVRFTAKPTDLYNFSSETVNLQSASQSTTLTATPKSFTVAVAGKVTSKAGPTIQFGRSGSYEIEMATGYKQARDLSISPTNCDVSGFSSGNPKGTITVKGTSPKITVGAKPDLYDINITVTPAGYGTVVCKQGSTQISKATYNTSYTVTATPASGKSLVSLTVNNTSRNSGDSIPAGSVTGTQTIVATFKSNGVVVTPTYSSGTLQYTKNGGSRTNWPGSGQSITFETTDAIIFYYSCDASAHTFSWTEVSA